MACKECTRTSTGLGFKNDLFNDGGVCVVINNDGGRAALLRNTTPRRGHWLTVKTIGRIETGAGPVRFQNVYVLRR